mgnify:CR=1 FL=1
MKGSGISPLKNYVRAPQVKGLKKAGDGRGYNDIKEWRPGKEKYARAKIYELTHKGKLICSLTYKKLLKEEVISEDPRSNPLFKDNNYMDKIYKKVIQKMNSKSSSDND